MSMNSEIGEAAGKIWRYLDENGATSAAKLATATDLGKNELQRAIGWLAKENKLNIEVKGRVETLSLK